MDGPEPDAGRRVGLILPAANPSAWIVCAVEDLLAAGAIVVALVVVPTRSAGGLTRAWRSVSRRAAAAGPDPERALPLPSAIAIEPVCPGPGGDPWEPLRSAAPDVVFCLGAQPQPPAPDDLRLGVWSLVPEADRRLGLEATVADAGAVSVGLRRVDGDPAVRRRSWARVHRQSVAATRARALWRASALPARALRDLWAAREAQSETEPATETREHPHRWALPRLAGRGLRTGLRRLLTTNEWFLAYQLDAPDPTRLDLGAMTPIAAPADRFWADPFPVVEGDRALIYVEEWPYALGHGILAVVELRRDGSWQRLGTALEKPYHLSHPFVFDWRGERFLLPESSAHGTLELYRCLDGPLSWTLEAVLMEDIRLVDATLHECDGDWWLFACVADERASPHDELHLYRADTPMGPWEPHPANPVRSDPRAARPAGSLFEWQGALYRPAQDCGVRYGRGIVVHRVDELSPAGYAERPVRRLWPQAMQGANRIHTLNRAGWLTVVDGHRNRWRRPT